MMAHSTTFTPPTPIMETSDFEWNVFENQQQFLDWHHQPPTSNTTLSPEPFLPSTTHLTYAADSLTQQAEIGSPESSIAGDRTGSEDPDLDEAGSKKAPTRRRIQNRKAQRAFRLRQKQHVENLEERLKSLVGEYEALQQRYTCLSVEYEKAIMQKDGSRGGGVKREMSDERWLRGGCRDIYAGGDVDEAVIGAWREEGFKGREGELKEFLLSDGWRA